jgi:hypothetical protein
VADQLTRNGSYGDVEPPRNVPKIETPPDIDRCVKRAYTRMKRHAPQRRLCIRFERGDSFSYLDNNGAMQTLSTATNPRGGGKPPHRIRNRYNYIRPIIEEKVSAATQRVPAYEVVPTTADPEDAGAASLATKVAVYGYDQWNLRAATINAVKTAIGLGGSAYAMPYFERDVGPYTQVDGEWVGQGDIRVKVFGGNEVGWEPGTDFDYSPYWCTWQALPCEEIERFPGYVGGKIVPDAASSDIPNDVPAEAHMAMVCDYYERPCPKWPQGRWLTLCNGRVIVDNRKIDPTAEYAWQDYPLRDSNDEVIDECLLHRLVYTHDPDDDDDLGLTWQLIDFERSIQDCDNKMLEYKNRGLNLQMLAVAGTIMQKPDDVPGAIRYYKAGPNGEQPRWEDPPSAQILNALIQIKNQFLQDMQMVAAFQDIQADPNVAARTGQLAIETAHARWQSFLGDLAEWHSRLMRHCLMLVARYYTEPRLLDIRGRLGWEPIKDFRGAKLMGQTNVRVFPGSLEYLSKQSIMNKVQFYFQIGAVTPQRAMQAIERGQIDVLTQGYDLDMARINNIIQRIKDGTVMDMPTKPMKVPAIDPATGGPAMDPATGQQAKVDVDVPGWMPDEWDDVPVWKENLAIWLKSDDYERSSKDAQEQGRLMWQALGELEADKAAKAAQEQMAMAQGLGMQNAAAPQGPPSLPSTANITADQPPQQPPAPTEGGSQ